MLTRLWRRLRHWTGRLLFSLAFLYATVATIGRFAIPLPAGVHHLTWAAFLNVFTAIAIPLGLALFSLSIGDAVLTCVGWVTYAFFALILNFAAIYRVYGTVANWGVHLSRVDALLVALGNFTTAGTAGMTPHTETVRRLVMVQLLIDIPATIALFGLLVAKIADPSVGMWREIAPAAPHVENDTARD